MSGREPSGCSIAAVWLTFAAIILPVALAVLLVA